MSEKHGRDEACFYCASDDELLRVVQRHDDRLPWDGRTIHMQTSESFCPFFEEDGE